MPRSGVPQFGDGHSPDEWNSDVSEHGVRDGRGETFTADEFMHLPSEQGSSESSDNLHRFSDLNSATWSQHHTLGPGHTESSPGDHTHNGGTSKVIPYKSISGLFALLPQVAAITGTTDASGFLIFNHGFKDINGNPAIPTKIFTQVHDTGTPTFGNIDIIDGSITSTQAKGFFVQFNGTSRASATVNFWIECYGV